MEVLGLDSIGVLVGSITLWVLVGSIMIRVLVLGSGSKSIALLVLTLFTFLY